MLQAELSAIISTFNKLPFVIKIFILSIFEWPFYTGFTVCYIASIANNEGDSGMSCTYEQANPGLYFPHNVEGTFSSVKTHLNFEVNYN